MNSTLKIDPNKIQIFHELKKRRIYVGELIYDEKRDVYELRYDENYVNSKNAIPIGPNLDLFKTVHTSNKGQLFSVFLDRIPEKSNPAYKDYCLLQGISPNEKNPIILLGSIGRRGPSSFIFEKVYKNEFSADDIIKMRKEFDITQNDLAVAFDIKKVTLQRIESGTGSDPNTIKLLQIYFNFPEVALWQLRQTGARVHDSIISRLIRYFTSKRKIKQVYEILKAQNDALSNWQIVKMAEARNAHKSGFYELVNSSLNLALACPDDISKDPSTIERVNKEAQKIDIERMIDEL